MKRSEPELEDYGLLALLYEAEERRCVVDPLDNNRIIVHLSCGSFPAVEVGSVEEARVAVASMSRD